MNEETKRVLLRIAEKLNDARHGYDFGEMDAEAAFSAATAAVAKAIQEAIDEAG